MSEWYHFTLEYLKYLNENKLKLDTVVGVGVVVVV